MLAHAPRPASRARASSRRCRARPAPRARRPPPAARAGPCRPPRTAARRGRSAPTCSSPSRGARPSRRNPRRTSVSWLAKPAAAAPVRASARRSAIAIASRPPHAGVLAALAVAQAPAAIAPTRGAKESGAAPPETAGSTAGRARPRRRHRARPTPRTHPHRQRDHARGRRRPRRLLVERRLDGLPDQVPARPARRAPAPASAFGLATSKQYGFSVRYPLGWVSASTRSRPATRAARRS